MTDTARASAPAESPAEPTHLDERAKAIIEQLQQDGRRSYSAIGRAVGLSEAAVRQRMARLLNDQVIKIVAVTNPMQLGFPRQAMVHVKTGPDLTGTADRLAAIPEVDYCVVVAGRWDVLVDFYTTPGSSSEGIRIYLARELAAVPDQDRHEREDEEAGMPLAWVPLQEAVQAVLAGRLHNPSICMGVLAAQVQSATGFTQLRAADSPWTDHPRERS